jgi:hypothetical protein
MGNATRGRRKTILRVRNGGLCLVYVNVVIQVALGLFTGISGCFDHA